MSIVVIVIGDSRDKPGEIEFMVHTEADLETAEGREASPATHMAAMLLDTFRKLGAR